MKFEFQAKYMKTVLRKNVDFSEFQDPGLWGSQELTELSRSNLRKRKAIEWLVLFEPWELVQTTVCFRMYGVLCVISPFSLHWRKIFIPLSKFDLYYISLRFFFSYNSD